MALLYFVTIAAVFATVQSAKTNTQAGGTAQKEWTLSDEIRLLEEIALRSCSRFLTSTTEVRSSLMRLGLGLGLMYPFGYSSLYKPVYRPVYKPSYSSGESYSYKPSSAYTPNNSNRPSNYYTPPSNSYNSASSSGSSQQYNHYGGPGGSENDNDVFQQCAMHAIQSYKQTNDHSTNIHIGNVYTN